MVETTRLPPGRIHHVAIVVKSIEAALSVYHDLLGLPLETVMDIPSDRVRIAFLGVGESKVELVQPTDDTTGVAASSPTRARASTTSASRWRISPRSSPASASTASS